MELWVIAVSENLWNGCLTGPIRIRKICKERKMNLVRNLIGAFFLVVSVGALAECPIYNGKYFCKGDGIEQEMTLKTETVNGVIQYSLDDTNVIPDGVTRPTNFQGGVFDISATCDATEVKVKVLFPGGEGDNPDCGTQKWNLIYSLIFQPDGININETHYAEAVCENGTVVPTEGKGTMSCVPVLP